jgi:hypothetical protein
MFEEIVESKFRQLKELTNNIKIVSLEEIRKSDLPNFAISFLCSELSEVNERNTLETYLEKSVKLIVNYTLRPKWTLINYLFGGFDSKPADEILKKAEVFGFYRYYVDLITNHIKDNSLMFVTQDDVISLTDEANKVVLDKLIRETSGIKIKNFFSQIYKLKYGDDREVNLDWSVPFLFIKLFLEDKGYTSIIEKYKIIPGLDDSMEIEMKTSIKILTDKYYVNDDFFVLKDESKKSAIEKPEIVSETVITAPPEKVNVGKPEKIDLTEEINKRPVTEDKPITDNKAKIEEEEKEEEEKPKGIIRIIKNIPAKKFHREKKSEAPKTKETIEIKEEPVPEIKEEKKTYESRVNIEGTERIIHLFKEEEKSFIIKKIFKGSKSAMHEAFDDLEKIGSWQVASGYLKDIFIKNKVDLYNKRVVLFTDILHDHFLQIEKGR